MTPSNVSTELVNLCPMFAYVRTLTESKLRHFARAASREERDLVTGQALYLAKIISNVITPLAREAQPNFASEYKRLADRLFELARPWTTYHPTDFPAESDKGQLILDRLESLEMRLDVILAKRRRVTVDERRAA